MFNEPTTWVTATTIVTLISTVYLGFTKMIGNNFQYSKFVNSGNKPLAKQCVKISNRTSMLILYTPIFLQIEGFAFTPFESTEILNDKDIIWPI